MKSIKFMLLLVLVAILFLIPLFVHNLYWVNLLTQWWIYILLTVSFWVVLSTGEVNLAHAGFAAIGGYTSAALVQVSGWNSWASLPIAIIVTGVIALILGVITLRITGIYFIIMTVALSFVVQIIFGMDNFFGYKSPFGGLIGMASLPAPNPFLSIHLSSIPALYYLTLIFTLLGVILLYRVSYSSMGRVFHAISISDQLSEHVGINTMYYKVLAFVIGSMCAGLAGVLYTYYTSAIQPTSFTLTQSTYYVVFAAVGGLNYFPGAIIGTLVMSYVSELIKGYAVIQNLIFSVLLILAMLLFKGGLWGLYLRGVDWFNSLTKRSKASVKSG